MNVCGPGCIKAGQLNQRVTIQQATSSAGGDPTPTFAHLATVWAEVLSSAASVRMRRDVIEEGISYVVRMRYRSDTDAQNTYRLVWHSRSGDRTLEIVSIYDPDGTGQVLEARCRETQ